MLYILSGLQTGNTLSTPPAPPFLALQLIHSVRLEPKPLPEKNVNKEVLQILIRSVAVSGKHFFKHLLNLLFTVKPIYHLNSLFTVKLL